MKMKMLLLCLLSLLIQCDKKKASSTSSVPLATIPVASSLASDSEISTALIAASLSELSTSLTAGDTLGDNSANEKVDETVEYASNNKIDRTRLCTVDPNGKSASVGINYNGLETKTIGKVTVAESASGIEMRTWTNTITNAVMKCTKKRLHAAIAWKSPEEVSGLRLQVNTHRRQKFTFGFHEKNGDFKQRSLTNDEEGTRTIQWLVGSGAIDTINTVKTLVTNVNKTQEFSKVNGEKVNISAVYASLDSDPILVQVVRNASGVPLSHSISTGSITMTKDKQFYIINKFTNLFFDLKKEDPCIPFSGTMSTSIYASPADTSPIKTYDIVFNAGVPTIKGDSESTEKLFTNINHKCAFVGGE